MSRICSWPSIVVGLAVAVGSAAVAAGRQSSAEWERYALDHPTMGVRFQLVVYAPSAASADAALTAAAARADALDQIFSDYRADSEAMQLVAGRVGQRQSVGPELWELLQFSQELSRHSGGAFDVTVGPLTQLWRQARQRRQLPDPADLKSALERVGWDKIQLSALNRVELDCADMRLDFGGIAKGYAADACLTVLREHGLPAAFVDAGGDIALGDPPPGESGWRVGVAALRPTEPLDETLCLSRCGVATSSDGLQALELDGVRYSHLLDPRSGKPMTTRRSVTVVAPNATAADGWASAWSVADPESCLRQADQQEGLDLLIVWEEPGGGGERRLESPGFARHRRGPESSAR